MAPDENRHDSDQDTDRVAVEVHDPALSERANQVLSEEVREALGTDEVELPAEQARHAGRDHPEEHGLFEALWERRVVIGMTLASAIVIAALLVLTTGSWWWLPAVVTVHAAATVIVTGAIIRTTTLVESPSPGAEAVLREEGVRDPERELNDQVRSFTGAPGPSAESVVEPGENQRETRPEEAPGDSASEQETAITPASEGSEPAGPRHGRLIGRRSARGPARPRADSRVSAWVPRVPPWSPPCA